MSRKTAMLFGAGFGREAGAGEGAQVVENAPRGRTFRRGHVIAGAAALLFAAPAEAAIVFSSSTPGLTSTTLAAGTYNLSASGGSGGSGGSVGSGSGGGGMGAFVSTTITLFNAQTISILVGGAGINGSANAAAAVVRRSWSVPITSRC